MIRKIIRYGGMIGVLFLLLIPQIVLSAELIGGIKIDSINTVFGQIALGGRLYINDSISNRVWIYDRGLRQAGQIRHNGTITAIGLDVSGRLYVAGRENHSITIYQNGIKVGQIGGDVLQIVSGIAIDDTTGEIYVTDAELNAVLRFDSSGNLTGTIMGLNLPKAIDIEGGLIYVLDSPVKVDPSNPSYTTTGVRISVYDRNGNLQRSFEDWLGSGGRLLKPQAMDVSNGHIYITDGSSIYIYTIDGTYTGQINTDRAILRGVALTEDSTKLYVTYYQSTTDKGLLVYSLDGTINMAINPQELNFITYEGTNPLPLELNITNTGTGTMHFITYITGSWLSLSTTAGTVSGGGTTTIQVFADTTGLQVGTYSGQIEIRNDAGQAVTIPVNLQIRPAPELTVNPTSLNFTYIYGGIIPPEQTVEITIKNATDQVWAVTGKDSWITARPLSGSGNALTMMLVGIAPTGLSPGTYQGRITIDAGPIKGSPTTITVTLSILGKGGNIKVKTNHDNAEYTITGPIILEGKGRQWSIDNIPAGKYTITYRAIQGYITPPDETKTLESGGTIEFRGTYIKDKKDAIILSMAGPSGEGLIKIIKGDGTEIGSFTVLDNEKGGIKTAVADIDGDGINEIIAARDRGSNIVGIYKANGEEIIRFTSGNGTKGLEVGAGDIDGDGRPEIVILNKKKGEITLYNYTTDGIIEREDLSISDRARAFVVADIDRDGLSEILILGKNRDLEIWRYNNGTMEKEVIDLKHIKGLPRYITAGDTDGDGEVEIVIYTITDILGRLYTLSTDGQIKSVIKDIGRPVYSITTGDTDGDGTSELIIGKRSEIKAYNPERTYLIKEFKNRGVSVSTGVIEQ